MSSDVASAVENGAQVVPSSAALAQPSPEFAKGDGPTVAKGALIEAVSALDGVHVDDRKKYANVTFTSHGEVVKHPKTSLGERYAAVSIRADYGGALGVSHDFGPYLDVAFEVCAGHRPVYQTKLRHASLPWPHHPRSSAWSGRPKSVRDCWCSWWQAAGLRWVEPDEMQLNSGSGRHSYLYVISDDGTAASDVANALNAAQDAYMVDHVAAFKEKEAAGKQRGKKRPAPPAQTTLETEAPDDEDEEELID